jgi:protoporphyrinogen oxidase
MMMVPQHRFHPDTTPPIQTTVAIVGGGLAGLACAIYLHKAGIPYQLIEASPQLGGKVQTTHHPDGFLLDHGFQAFNTAYKEAKALLDFETLQLQPFYPGAVVRYKGSFNKVGDPQRDAGMWLFGLYSPVGTFKDKWLTLSLRNRFINMNEHELYTLPEEPTIDFLKRFGFTEGYINAFFRPFYGGVFLEDSLSTSIRKFAATFQTFSKGTVCLPANGMQSIVTQLAEQLPPETIHLGQALIDVSPPNYLVEQQQPPRILTFNNGQQLAAQHVVLAMPLPQIASLLGQPSPIHYNTCWTLYFRSKEKPPLAVREPILVLNAEGSGIVQHLCFLNEVSPQYATNGQSLCSVTLNPQALAENLTEAEAVLQTKANLKQWFGPMIDRWELVQSFPLYQALPSQTVLYGTEQATLIETLSNWQQQWQIHIANDALDTASINGALKAGKAVAHQLIQFYKHHR